MHIENKVRVAPRVFWTQIITGKKENQENGMYGLNSGKYTDISDFDDSGDARNAERHVHCCVTY